MSDNPFVHLAKTDRKAFNEARRGLRRANQDYPPNLVRCPEREVDAPFGIIECWRSRNLLATVFDQEGFIRVSVNRTAVQQDGHWQAGISWDDLMKVKREIGRGDQYAVELLPSDGDVVNIANIRHFFLVDRPDFAWADRSKDGNESE